MTCSQQRSLKLSQISFFLTVTTDHGEHVI